MLARTYHLGLKAKIFENLIFTFGCFSLKAVYNPCKLSRFLQVAKFLFMYSFTHTSEYKKHGLCFVFRHLPTEIIIFINVCYQMKCFRGDSFSFFRSRFCYYSNYLFDFMWSSNKVFKDNKIFRTVHLRPYIRYQEKYLNLFWKWCCF